MVVLLWWFCCGGFVVVILLWWFCCGSSVVVVLLWLFCCGGFVVVVVFVVVDYIFVPFTKSWLSNLLVDEQKNKKLFEGWFSVE